MRELHHYIRVWDVIVSSRVIKSLELYNLTYKRSNPDNQRTARDQPETNVILCEFHLILYYVIDIIIIYVYYDFKIIVSLFKTNLFVLLSYFEY